MKKYYYQASCLCCANLNLNLVIDLGNQPLANNLIHQKDADYDTYPLALNGCSVCGHLQLKYFVDPTLLFDDYSYASGTSNTLKNYFDWFAKECLKIVKSGSNVLEIASNDGSLLYHLNLAGYKVTGIDPAKNLCLSAAEKGFNVICDYWPSEKISKQTTYDLIIAQNVFAHNPDPYKFLIGIKNALSENGIGIIQTSQAMMFERGQFDTIYHEHYSFFSISSFKKLIERCGLVLNEVLISDIHGDSYIFCFSKKARILDWFMSDAFYKEKINFNIEFLPENFSNALDDFNLKVTTIKKDVLNIIQNYKQDKYKIIFVGAAAKAIVFMNYAEIHPDYVIDEAQLKIGKFIPQIDVEIKPLNIICNIEFPILYIISAWNFKDELILKIKGRRQLKDKFLTYFPTFELSE
jgi:2-polyprenyl-3-methyl-5-hydroxy-6-metoxy-1,4-benzoquinol methylase